ncbi:MAG: gliding motility-associated C-terminal domain-containing protein [Saprospiraceae bacterium]|nr:gliding motility-associated C-terminal domain-containing protein [Saprospiraceae bacterium]
MMKTKSTLLLTALLVVVGQAYCTHLTTLPTTSSLNCTATIDAGSDQTFCSAGATANLAVTINGNARSIDWSPANLVNDPKSTNPVATVNTTTTFSVTVGTLSDENLIVNGDFSQGDFGFTSDYIPGTGGSNGLLTMEGQYAVDDNARDTHRRFARCDDHTGNGNMMVVNASGDTDNVWCQTVAVNPDTDYDFSAWVTTVERQNPAQLQFSINGTLIGSVFNASSNTCLWEEFFAQWNSGGSTSADICIVNVNLSIAGNDFALDDISFKEICTQTEEVTITIAELNADWNSPGTLCQNEPAFVLDELLDAEATPGGTWTVDGQPTMTINPGSLSIGMHEIAYTVTEGNCTESFPENVMIIGSPTAGLPAAPDRFCSNFNNPIDLSGLLNGADMGGNWTASSSNPSSGSAFDGQAGTFNTLDQAAGTYVFTYAVTGPAGCPASTADVTVIIEDTPNADAGEEGVLDCIVDRVTLGGSSLSVGADLSYEWTLADGTAINMGNTPFPEVTAAGTYVLTVTNLANGCSNTDEVQVIDRITNITAVSEVSPVSCNSDNDGLISITEVSGGDEPYMYALNDGVFQAQPVFGNLSAGSYQVRVMDANGCEEMLAVTLESPEPLTAVIIAKNQEDNNDPVVALGDSIQLQVLLSKEDGITNLIWEPEQADCPGCTSIWVSPTVTTNYAVQVADIAACEASASITIRVDRTPKIFVPNAFSPNNDGKNDFFVINAAGEQVNVINSFQILDRWGNLVFQRDNFMPNDEQYAWDGTFRGQLVNSGVYVFFAEITLQDGSLVQTQGEVAVIY